MFHGRELQIVFADFQERSTDGCSRTSSTRNAKFSNCRLRRMSMESWVKFCSQQTISGASRQNNVYSIRLSN